MFAHTINISSCKDIEVSTVLASSTSENKKLCVVVVPEMDAMRYDVLHGEECVYTNDKLVNAVDNYNLITRPPHQVQSVRTKITRIASATIEIDDKPRR
jgi:hypothetical protein